MSPFSRIVLLVAAVALAPAALAGRGLSQATPQADWESLTRRLETAALSGNSEAVKTERLACLRLLAASPAPAADRAALLRYTVAYAGWRLAFAQSLPAKEQADLLNDAEVQLNEAIRLNGRFAEAVGLLSSVLGSKIAKAPDLGMTLGPQSDQQLARALGMEPANPRLVFLRGESQFNTPPEYGGSVRDSEGTFRRALTLFGQEPAIQPWPNWGRFDAHAWLGQALVARGDKAGARAEYEKALRIAPDSGWVRYALLPAVK